MFQEEEEEEEELEPEDDPDYWQRVLGASYSEHKVAQIQEEERRLRSLGKGKRIRRQVRMLKQMLDSLVVFYLFRDDRLP